MDVEHCRAVVRRTSRLGRLMARPTIRRSALFRKPDDRRTAATRGPGRRESVGERDCISRKTALVGERRRRRLVPCFADFASALRPTSAAEPRLPLVPASTRRADRRSWSGRNDEYVTTPRPTSRRSASSRFVCRRLAEQREIADFLDAETARIDALIEKKRQMMSSSRSGAAIVAQPSTASSAWPRVKLTLSRRLGSATTRRRPT